MEQQTAPRPFGPAQTGTIRMKKRIVYLIAALTAGCAVFLGGCSSTSTASLIALSSNWYSLTTFKNIQPTFTEGNANFSGEKMVYSVTFAAPESGNATYSVDYPQGGTYTTEFYATVFDVQTYTHENYREAYEEAAAKGDIVVYCYKTALTIPEVTFTYNGETATLYNDGITSVCYFLSCADYLRPLYSEQTIVSATPANYQATSLAGTYTRLDRVYKNYYDYKGTAVLTELTDNLDAQASGSSVEKLGGTSKTTFDVSSLEIAIRAMSNLSSSLSQSVRLVTAESGVQNYSLTGSSDALDSAESASVTALLKQSGLFEGEDGEEVGTVAVSVSYSGALTGVSQTYWFAAVENKLNNTGRATMLKIQSPLAYGLGTLVYTLSSVESTLWNG